MQARITIFVAALLCLAACQPAATHSPNWKSKPVSALTPMSETEVRALLSDVMVGPYCCDAASVYYRDGRFRHYGYSLERGTWKLQGNTACSLSGNPQHEWCRSFYKDVAGTPYFSRWGEEEPTPVNPRAAPAEIKTLRQMSEAEIRALVTGATLRQDNWGVESIYYRNGRYSYYNGRRADHGHYAFKANRVCDKVDGSERENCYFIYVDKGNRLYWAGRESGDAGPITVHRAPEEELNKRAVELTPRKK